ncbi:RNA polymerase sigma factor, sigma-70 family protein [Asticcacaulis biprosthecium C19]|uniref:RNA polymerase sigma factor, sigma-70 family protein n=1 Tax=Asticcacaulis biprosthecium C19 TaxID=715226 RepID=F4QTV4_9CAUL|nr:sigma-70 family RNA polymerase sigma factor [Asticcacaulis biprosthecium]EGF89254.1 RNA polymerase sigma factor, sigma-70 family protein [Asticcacaulis biprosthecium C19]
MADVDNLNGLVENVAKGDKPALKTLYNLMSGRLFSVLLRMVRQRDVAEDLLQDVFVTVWRKAHQFDVRRGNAEVWLFSITRRKAIDRLRISYRETVGTFEDVASVERETDIYVGIGNTENYISVRKCLKELRPDVHRALQLCYVFGLTHEELAEEMKVPVGTAKSWVRRGLAQLKESLSIDERT